MKKNKERNHQKKQQRRAANGKARRQISAMTKNLVADMAKKGIRLGGMGSGIADRTTHTSGDTVAIPQCNGVGNCCRNVIVNLDPSDVWRILHNEKVRQDYGVDLTMDLVSKTMDTVSADPDTGIIKYWIDPRVGVPRCKLLHTKKEEGIIECIFLEENDGKVECLLGDDRPTICLANPIGRVGQKDKEGKLASWGYVLRDEPCQKCVYKVPEGVQTVIGEFLTSRAMEERYRFLDRFYGLQGWMANNVKVEELRMLATLICFDWDRFLVEVGGHSKEDVKKVRPESPEHVLVSARLIVDGIMKGSENGTDVVNNGNDVDVEGKAGAPEEGMAITGESVSLDPNGRSS